jgi:hypothetical protein
MDPAILPWNKRICVCLKCTRTDRNGKVVDWETWKMHTTHPSPRTLQHSIDTGGDAFIVREPIAVAGAEGTGRGVDIDVQQLDMIDLDPMFDEALEDELLLSNVPAHNKTQTISGSSGESNIATPIGSDGSDSSGIGFVTSFSALPCLVHS